MKFRLDINLTDLAEMVSLLHLLSFLLLLLRHSAVGQISGNVSLGSSLSTLSGNSSWVSSSGEFAFGFHPLPNENLFLLAIWFEQLPEKTVVWFANVTNAVQRGSKVGFTNSGQLLLTDHQGRRVWKAESQNGTVTSAELLNTGNFVLRTRNSGFGWQSFDNPTDTILPNQLLGTGSKLWSKLTERDYSSGRFQLRFQDDGNLVFFQVNSPTGRAYDPYWTSNTSFGSSSRLIYNQSGQIFIENLNGSSFNLTNASPTATFYHRATLDFDGVFRQYVYYERRSSNGSKSGNWSVILSIPSNICTRNMNYETVLGGSVCGFNSYCKLGEDGRPTCECLPGYSYFDQNDRFGGCKQGFISQACANNESRTKLPNTHFDLREMPNTQFPRGNYEEFYQVNEDWCKQNCLNDCMCAAAFYRNATCYKKKKPLSNGMMDPIIEGKMIIKLPTGITRPPVIRTNKCKENDNQKTLILTGSILIGSSVFLNFLLLSAISCAFCHSYHRKLIKIHPDSSPLAKSMLCFTYKELEEATNGFKEEVGRGAFGTVYKGVIPSVAKNFVAVKKLDKVVQEGEREFKSEVTTIGQTHHKNLVRLVGFCDEGDHRLLVYEFMSSGSLASFIFGSFRPKWNERIQIISGIANGLMYLHEECSTQIIHCDIKPQNILLDDYFTARISDFGLAKLLKTDQTRSLSGIRGTRGYVAPEWFKNVTITAKVDVYSFGVMLLEIIACRKNIEIEHENEEKLILVNWAYICLTEKRLDLLAENDEEAMNDMRRLERLVMVAVWCIQENPSRRPSMKKATQMIEGLVEIPVPPQPFSCI